MDEDACFVPGRDTVSLNSCLRENDEKPNLSTDWQRGKGDDCPANPLDVPFFMW